MNTPSDSTISAGFGPTTEASIERRADTTAQQDVVALLQQADQAGASGINPNPGINPNQDRSNQARGTPSSPSGSGPGRQGGDPQASGGSTPMVNSSSEHIAFMNFLTRFFGPDKDPEQHVIAAIKRANLHDWESFFLLDDESLRDSLEMRVSRVKWVPISKSYKLRIQILLEWILGIYSPGDPDKDNPDYYQKEDFKKYFNKWQKDKRKQATSTAATPITPPYSLSTPGSHYTSSNPGNKKAERARKSFLKADLDKTKFTHLRDGMNYTSWKEQFVRECRVQQVYRVIDPGFDPDGMQDELDIELYDMQNNFMWTVLLYALKSTLAQLIFQDHTARSTARTAFFAFEVQEMGNVNQTYTIATLSSELQATTLDGFVGTRQQFLKQWFELVKRLNDATDKDDQLTYTHARSLLARAVRSDPDLTRVFLTLNTHAANKSTAFADMKKALCKEARNLDYFGMSRVAQDSTRPISRQSRPLSRHSISTR
jgi:hypothetical protein